MANPLPAPQGEAVERLCQYVIDHRKKVVVHTTQFETIWSDGAIFEVARTFPTALAKLVACPTERVDIRSTVDRLAARMPTEWADAMVIPSSPRGDQYSGVKRTDGVVIATVVSLYLEYLAQRYPTAIIRMKGKFDPILFVVEGEIRAAIMPMRFTDAAPGR